MHANEALEFLFAILGIVSILGGLVLCVELLSSGHLAYGFLCLLLGFGLGCAGIKGSTHFSSEGKTDWRGVDPAGHACRWEFNSIGDGLASCRSEVRCSWDNTSKVATCRRAVEANP